MDHSHVKARTHTTHIRVALVAWISCVLHLVQAPHGRWTSTCDVKLSPEKNNTHTHTHMHARTTYMYTIASLRNDVITHVYTDELDEHS